MTNKTITEISQENYKRAFKDAHYTKDDFKELDKVSLSESVNSLKEKEMLKNQSLKKEASELEKIAKDKLEASTKDAEYVKDNNTYSNDIKHTTEFVDHLRQKVNH